MKRIIAVFLAIMPSLFFNCINAPRNNKYDPENPNKADVKGYVFEPDCLVASGAVVNLLNSDDNIVQSDTSDAEGCFAFIKIDPGIYKIIARTKYYTNVVIENESLWAGTKLYQYPVFFTTFHFEDDEINTIPYGFSRISGEWKVLSDTTGNHFYSGSDTGDTMPAITFFRNRAHNFQFGFKIKVSGTSGDDWQTGIFLWHQNDLNHYEIKITKSLIRYSLIKNGLETIFYTKNITFATDVWHNITTIHTGDALIFYLDGNFQFPISLVSPAFSDGLWGLYVMNLRTGAFTSISIDDVYLAIVNQGGNNE
uniref:Carboxypeptidase regulatory-like domain-containing protein n=1 Tax=candidate division WOR-3 bacterium TaxID=2052148 RepID=A0A7V0Z5I6_UNCW3